MTYQHTYTNQPMFWVSYRGTRNGAFIRATSANEAKWIYAKGEGLQSIVYFKASKWRNI